MTDPTIVPGAVLMVSMITGFSGSVFMLHGVGQRDTSKLEWLGRKMVAVGATVFAVSLVINSVSTIVCAFTSYAQNEVRASQSYQQEERDAYRE